MIHFDFLVGSFFYTQRFITFPKYLFCVNNSGNMVSPFHFWNCKKVFTYQLGQRLSSCIKMILRYHGPYVKEWRHTKLCLFLSDDAEVGHCGLLQCPGHLPQVTSLSGSKAYAPLLTISGSVPRLKKKKNRTPSSTGISDKQ